VSAPPSELPKGGNSGPGGTSGEGWGRFFSMSNQAIVGKWGGDEPPNGPTSAERFSGLRVISACRDPHFATPPGLSVPPNAGAISFRPNRSTRSVPRPTLLLEARGQSY
jgi:hypothetical protein